MSVLAWRMHWLAWINRTRPKTPASIVFSDIEIKILSLKILKKIKTKMTIDEAIICLAKLGGYLGRKNDPKPGALVLIRGWMSLLQSVEDYDILKLMYKC